MWSETKAKLHRNSNSRARGKNCHARRNSSVYGTRNAFCFVLWIYRTETFEKSVYQIDISVYRTSYSLHLRPRFFLDLTKFWTKTMFLISIWKSYRLRCMFLFVAVVSKSVPISIFKMSTTVYLVFGSIVAKHVPTKGYNESSKVPCFDVSTISVRYSSYYY